MKLANLKKVAVGATLATASALSMADGISDATTTITAEIGKVAPVVSSAEVVEKPSVSKNDSSVLVMGGKSQQNLMYDGYVEAGKEFSPNGGVVGSN